jgi:hypothetical protein
MATQAQIQANRRNALRSTGPRTAAGKRRVSRNAVKHGLRSKSAEIPARDSEEFHALLETYLESLQPRDGSEYASIRNLAEAEWGWVLSTRHEARVLATMDPEKSSGKLAYLAELESKAQRRFFAALEAFNELRSRQSALPSGQQTCPEEPARAPENTVEIGEQSRFGDVSGGKTGEQTQSDGGRDSGENEIRHSKPICRLRTRPAGSAP